MAANVSICSSRAARAASRMASGRGIAATGGAASKTNTPSGFNAPSGVGSTRPALFKTLPAPKGIGERIGGGASSPIPPKGGRRASASCWVRIGSIAARMVPSRRGLGAVRVGAVAISATSGAGRPFATGALGAGSATGGVAATTAGASGVTSCSGAEGIRRNAVTITASPPPRPRAIPLRKRGTKSAMSSRRILRLGAGMVARFCTCGVGLGRFAK